MRIISGKYRGRRLLTLDGLQTRPMLDATKEAIFSSLGNYLPDFEVLDLFGGSGALSLEALSRGAKTAYIIDLNPEAIKIITKNSLILDDPQSLKILPGNYQTYLKEFKNKRSFDLIFIDPPFKLKVIEEIIETILANNLLNELGYLVIQYPKEDVIETIYPGLKVKLCRRYSSSEVLILEKE